MTQTAPNSLRPGSVLGKYRIVQMLGSGGMGAVYSAVHGEIGKTVALKTLTADAALDERAHARFLREAAAASKLDHPHVVNVMDYGTDAGVPYLVMEHLRGEDLAQHLARTAPMAVDATVDVLLAVCAGVQAAHDAGIVHRDLKPQNIFLARTPTGETVPKVLDFGISKVRDDLGTQLTNTGTVLGTTHYLSPEQVMARPVDGRSDQYALGVILYECVTGRRPHDGETIYLVMHSIGEGRFLPPRQVRRDLPEQIEAVILRAMSRDAAGRFESVHAMAQALLPFATAKRQMMWGEYYGGAGALGRSSTVPLKQNQPPLAPTRTVDPRGMPPSSEMPIGPVAVNSTGALDPALRPRRSVLPIALGLTAALGGGALWWYRSQRAAPPTANAARTDDATKIAAPPPDRAGAGGAPATQPTAAPTVRISVQGPPGLTATVDGARVPLPLTWPRDGREREVRFEAPGHAPKVETIAATEDRAVTVELDQVAKPPRGSGGTGTGSAGSKDRRAAGKGTRPPATQPAASGRAKPAGATPPSAITDL